MGQVGKDKTICLVCLSDNPDHQEVVYSLYGELRDSGFDVHTVGIEGPKTPFAYYDERNHYVRCPSRPGITSETLNPCKLRAVISEMKRICPDYVYFESVHAWNVPIARAMRRYAKVFEVIHDVDPHDGSKAVEIANRLCARAADFTVIRNGKDRELCAEKYGLSLNRVLELDSWRAFPSFDPPAKSGEVLFFGRLRRYKGLASLLSIASKANDVTFNVMGKSDRESEGILDSLRVLPNVNVTEGFIEPQDMEDAFRHADCIVVPYESASQSGIIMDAYRYSRPVVAYNVGAISEQIVDGVTGYLVSPGDEESFITAVREIVGLDGDALKEKSRNSYLFGLEKYSAHGAMPRFIEMLSASN